VSEHVSGSNPLAKMPAPVFSSVFRDPRVRETNLSHKEFHRGTLILGKVMAARGKRNYNKLQKKKEEKIS